MATVNGVPVPERTRDLLNLSYVRRWVIAPMDREQSVAEHSYRVAVIVWGLHDILMDQMRGYKEGDEAVKVFGVDRAIMLALTHDAYEVWTGDIPGTHKDAGGLHKWPDPEELLNHEIAVKVADSLETWYWWLIHGDKSWTHPLATKSGCGGRDIRKIYHYTRDWPELLAAARALVSRSMRVDDITLKATFPDVKDGAYTL